MKIGFIFIFPLLTACYDSTNSTNQELLKKDTLYNKSPVATISDTAHSWTLYEFLDAIKKNFITIEKEFPADWVKSPDVDTLLSLIESTDRCRCVLNPISSYIPEEKANLGGYAILILNSYRNNKPLKFYLWACPTTNMKDVKEILIWNKSREK